MIRLIAAIDRRQGLAKHGFMPWNIPDDEHFFTKKTKEDGGHVLSGGTTFRTGYKGRPLVDRHNYILTHDTTLVEGVTLVHNLGEFLEGWQDKILWVAGGASVFEQVMAAGKADELYITHVDADFGCDQFFPDYSDDFKLADQGEVQEQNGFRYSYTRYNRI